MLCAREMKKKMLFVNKIIDHGFTLLKNIEIFTKGFQQGTLYSLVGMLTIYS
jgi:hypothetical protein